jgi:hypothetical protein
MLGLCALGNLVLAAPGQADAQGTVAPILKCVRFRVDSPGATEAFFGYMSTHATAVTIDLGPQNFFSPGAVFRGQPTVFHPGLHENAFSTTFPVSASLTQVFWVLDGHTVAATSFDHRRFCDPPRFRGEWNAATPYVSNDLVTFDGELWLQVDLYTIGIPSLNRRPGSPGAAWIAWDGLRLGRPDTFPSSQTFTFPRNGVLTIRDGNVRADSVIVVQYVGARAGNELIILDAQNGSFTVKGSGGKQFRYVVFN